MIRSVAVAASCLMVACGAVAPPPTENGQPVINVNGILDRGQTPACPTDEPCDPPATSKVVFSSSDRPDVSATLGADGTFALHLDPGSYSIRTAPPAFSAVLEPSQVRVPATGTVELHLRIVRTPF